jgi:hypothetical protein
MTGIMAISKGANFMTPVSRQWLRIAGGVIAVVAIGALARALFRGMSRRASLATPEQGGETVGANTQATSVAQAWSNSARAAVEAATRAAALRARAESQGRARANTHAATRNLQRSF